MREKTRIQRDWQVNSLGWTISRRFNNALSTNQRLWQVIAGHVQAIGCVLDAYRSRLSVKSAKLIANPPLQSNGYFGSEFFRSNNAFLCFVASPTATATIEKTNYPSPSSRVVSTVATTATSRQTVVGKTIGTVSMSGPFSIGPYGYMNLIIPITSTTYQASARRFAFVRGQFNLTRSEIEATVTETTDVLVVRV